MIANNGSIKFCKKIGIPVDSIFINEHKRLEFSSWLSKFKFHELISFDYIFNATRGGLVLGNLHCEGGIFMIKALPNSNYQYLGEMEGWEYLTSPIKNNDYKIKFEKVNKQASNIGQHKKTNFIIPENCKVIDTSGIDVPILLCSNDPQFVIRRSSTQKYIDEIIKLDAEMENYDSQ